MVENPAHREATRIRFGKFEADLRTGELRKSGIRLKLPGQPFKLLTVLLTRSGELVTREDLRTQLWGEGTIVDFDHSLGSAIAKLREVLGDSPTSPRFIETLSRRGYRFVAPVEPIFDSAPPTAVPEPLTAIVEPLPLKSDVVPMPTMTSEPVIERPAPRYARTIAVVGLSFAATIALLLFLRTKEEQPHLVRATQITWTGGVYPGEIELESFAGLATDGARIYFQAMRDGRVTLAHASGGDGESFSLLTPAEIIRPALADISPDGSKLLVEDHASSLVERPLWIVPSSGGAAQRVANVLAHDATWMPDGQSILYASGRRLWITRNDGQTARQFASVPGRAFWLRWSPDGTRLRFTLLEPAARTTSIWELSAEGTNLKPILSGWNKPPAECCGSWMPDGRSYVFQVNSEGASNIWMLPERRSWWGSRSAKPVQLTAGPLKYIAPVPARHANRLFVIGARTQTQLCRFDAASHQFVRFLPELSTAGRTAFSVGGSRVAWVSTKDGSLWQSRVDGTQRLRLTSGQMQVFMMSWSPDGKRLALMGKKPGAPWKIFLLSAEGGDLQTLINDTHNEADPGWSPDGNSLVFGRSPEYMEEDSVKKAIYTIDLRRHRISMLPCSEGMFSPRWSPDGRYIAAMPLDQRKLMLFDRATSKWTELAARSVDNPQWSKDAKYIYFRSFMEDKQPIYRVRVVDKAAERIADFDNVRQADAVNYTFPGLSADGVPLVSVNLWSADLFALEWKNP